MAEKTLKSRIIHKHDTAANWLKGTNFIPKQGEIIVYDVDENYNYERFKIGDGKTAVNSLPFADGALREDMKFINDSAGYVVVVNDSAEYTLQNLVLYGKTTQNGSPTPDTPVALSSAGSDGSITVNAVGKNLIDINALTPTTSTSHTVNGDAVHITATTAGAWRGVKSASMMLVAGKTYIMSAMVDNIVGGVATMGLRKSSDNKFVKRGTASVAGSLVVSYTATEDIEVYAAILCTDGTSASGDVTYSNIMLEVNDAATAYEPYKNGGSAVIATQNGLNGIPVSEGGNYTDESGQQWICDEIDLARGVYIKRIATIASTSMTNWTASSVSNPNGHVYVRAISAALPYGAIWTTRRSADDLAKIDLDEFVIKKNTSGITIVYIVSAAETAAKLAESIVAENSTLMYALATPVETAISDDILQLLRSQYPVTTVYNDCGARICVNYVTNRMIDVEAALEPALLYGTLPVSRGGTGADNAVEARENLLIVVSATEPSSPTAGMLWFDIS